MILKNEESAAWTTELFRLIPISRVVWVLSNQHADKPAFWADSLLLVTSHSHQ